MKKILLLLSFLWAAQSVAWAQLPDGTVAPNFTVVDIYGQSHNLYNLLDQGKTVYLDFFATWCAPCWAYHQTHALKDIWDMYGPPGTGEAYVISIESDAGTTVPCITNSAGCVGGTQGDWSAGTPYPIADAASVAGQFAITYYPTIFMVCPADRKVYEVGQQPASGLWASRSVYCPPLVVNTVVNSIQNTRCINTNTGSIDISVSGGSGPYTYNWSNGAHTQDLNNIPAGTYTCTVTNANGWTGVTDAIVVEGPAAPLAINVVENIPVGCNGIAGALTVQAEGGWPDNYTYIWSTGQGGETASGLQAGTYTVTVTDDNNCTKTLSITMPPAAPPSATIATPATLTCAAPTLQLSVTASGGSGNYNYQWFASNGGHIVSGATSATPTVDAAGNYTVQVSDAVSTCAVFTLTTVSANLSAPAADAGPSQSVSCAVPTAVLTGTGSSGANITYLWSATNGGNIVTGGNTLTPTVNAAGTYSLLVTNTTNGCTQSSSTTVAGNNIPPSAIAAGGSLTCAVDTVNLALNTNAGAPGFAWTGPNGYVSTVQNPAVDQPGSYFVTVLDSITGCSNVDTAVVAVNVTPPGATATGGTLTCAVGNITLNGSSPDTTAIFSWTGPNGYTSAVQNPVVSVPGDYLLQVTSNVNGCTSTAATAVAQNTNPPVAMATTPGNLNCVNAQIQLDGTGSTQGAGIAYSWSTPDGHIVSGENSATPIVDTTGTYLLLVTNMDNGCTATASTAVAQSAVVTATMSNPTPVACYGGTNGSATVQAGGGNALYTYLWSNGDSTATAASLAAGTYSVTVTDGETCSAVSSVTITQPDVLAANATATAQSAAGVNDGVATASPTGGTVQYTFMWNTSQTTQTITGLAPGSYTVTVTDANGCSDIQSVIVNAYNCAIAGTISGTNVTCAGAANGVASIELTAGNNPFTYIWNNGSTTASIANLPGGTYTVEAIDATNCALVLTISLSEPLPLDANATATDETAAGANDGTATANPSGGTSGYAYLWNNGETTPAIDGLAPGTYTVVITDANGCTTSQSVIVNAFNCVISAQATVVNVSCNGQNNGSISIAVSGGTAPFDYVWSNGETTGTISSLAPGVYTATVTDADGCQLVSGGSITEPEVLQMNADVVHPTCAEGQTGSIALTPAGGTAPFAFTWSNGSNTANLTGLNAGAYTVTLSDANSCNFEQNFQLVAQDNVAPVIEAQNTTLNLSASGVATATLQTLNALVSDNCSVVSSVVTPSDFDCSDLGEQQVSISATDGNGNVSLVTITVLVADNIAPMVTCPTNIVRCWYDNIVEYDSPVASDNCLGNGGEWKQTEGLPSGSEFPVGVTNQTYHFTDASGNLGECSFSIQITAPIVLGVNSVTHDVNNQGIGAIDISVAGGSEPYTYTWTRNGEFFANTEDLTGLNAGLYAVEVKDANGCLLSNEAIEVSNTTAADEPEWLTGISIRPNPTAGAAQIVFANLPSAALELSLVDATGRVVWREWSELQPILRLDCATLPSGIYFVRFHTGVETGIRKLIISR